MIQENGKLFRLRINIEEHSTTKTKAGQNADGIYERLKALKRVLPGIQVKGLPQIIRGVISRNAKDESLCEMLVTGYGLAEVMGTDGKTE